MKITSAEFEVSAPSLATCPKLALPEFAFIGRSNVGKSSLLNCLTERRALAKVSDLPGKTRLMNFFVINRKWRMVDLPGYGYAKVAKTQRADFNEAAADYMEERENLLCTFVLIDSRLEPQAIDRTFIEWIVETGIPYALVFTKTDKQSEARTESSVARYKREVLNALPEMPPLFITSAETKLGRSEILAFIHARLK